jgi:cytochrome c biogenesis protein CcmG, thiol:disulfide interchange protein DsbE
MEFDQNPFSEPAVQPRSRLPLWAVALSFGGLTVFLVMMALGLSRAREGPITVGNRVPVFELTTFDGEQISTADFEGKVIVVNFWASWCKPCEQEAAELEEAWKQYAERGDVVFLGMNYVDTETAAKGYLEKFAITYPNGPDLRTKVSQMFRIAGVPETYIIDKEGRLGYVKKGPFNSIGEITNAIDSILN